eukprot:scaffold1307_cov200-Pinguiococcus_pyrenoidosus.AAC.1
MNLRLRSLVTPAKQLSSEVTAERGAERPRCGLCRRVDWLKAIPSKAKCAGRQPLTGISMHPLLLNIIKRFRISDFHSIF